MRLKNFNRYDQRRCPGKENKNAGYRSRPRMTTEPPAEEDDYDNDENDDYAETSGSEYGHNGLVDIASNTISLCPVENGVVRTAWGAVNVGSVLAGMDKAPFSGIFPN